jgi:2'-5' RNA ligase
MPFRINLRVSGDAASYWELVDRASGLEAKPSIRSLCYPPHITLAKYDESLPGELEAVINALADAPALTLTFERLGSFDPGFLILWVAPKPQAALLDLHARVHSMIDAQRCRLPYRPANWTPHCSIALRIAEEHRGTAARLLATSLVPFKLTFDVVDAVSPPPIAIIAERTLQDL